MKKVLVVVDMQQDFVSGALAAENGTSIVETVLAQVQDFEGQVVYTLDTHGVDYLQTQEGSKLPVPHCIKGSEGWKIPPQLQAALDAKGAVAYEKPSFGSPALVLALEAENRRGKIHEIVLVGICTDICVLTNALALKCFLPETTITVQSAACAGVTLQRHRTALEAMGFCQINVV